MTCSKSLGGWELELGFKLRQVLKGNSSHGLPFLLPSWYVLGGTKTHVGCRMGRAHLRGSKSLELAAS